MSMERLTRFRMEEGNAGRATPERAWREASGAPVPMTIGNGCRTTGERHANGLAGIVPIGSCQGPGSTASSIACYSGTTGSTLSFHSASRISARGRGGMSRATNASALAWAPTMALAAPAAGSRSQIPSRSAGGAGARLSAADGPVVKSA